MKYSMASIILSLLITVFCGSASAELAVWCAGDGEKIPPYSIVEKSNIFWNGDDKTVRVCGARNEYVAFQLILKAAGERVEGVMVIPDILTGGENGAIGIDNIELFKEHYMAVKTVSSVDDKAIEDASVGVYPTQMIPFKAGSKKMLPFKIERDQNQPIWVDIYIPESAAPGEYESSFKVTINGNESAKIKVILTVWDFMLSHETHLRTYVYYGSEQLRWAFGYKDSNSLDFRSLEDAFFQMAHQHRFVLCPNLEMGCDYNKFEEYWNVRGRGAYIDGSAYKERVGKNTPVNTWVIQIDDFDYEPEYQRLCREALKFFREKNLANILMLYVYDEPDSKKAYDFIRERCSWAHKAVGKELPCMVTVAVKPPNASWGTLKGYVDIWNSGDSSLQDVEERQRAGERVWTYNMGWGGGPYIDTPGISGMTQGWIAWKFKLDGWMLWDSCYWVDTGNLRDASGKRMKLDRIDREPMKYATDVWNDPMTFDQLKRPNYKPQDAIRLNGDGVLFYPGAYIGLQEPISSFVMKSLRRGLQDYEYLWLAKSLGKEKEIGPIVDSVVFAPKKWNKDASAWYKARMDLAKVILSASKEPHEK